jgi:hypothetical protein
MALAKKEAHNERAVEDNMESQTFFANMFS